MEKDNLALSIIPANTPVIDWENCLMLANGKEELAKTILHMFVISLPDSLEIINQHFAERALKPLANELHKLLGGCSYAGTPRLKLVTKATEAAVKEKDSACVSELIELLNSEIMKVLQEYQQQKDYQL